MRMKRSCIVFLLILNAVLLAALLLSRPVLPAAVAQAGATARGGFLAVTAKPAGQSFDVLYVVDLPNKKLHAFCPPSSQNKGIEHVDVRDLKKDFEG